MALVQGTKQNKHDVIMWLKTLELFLSRAFTVSKAQISNLETSESMCWRPRKHFTMPCFEYVAELLQIMISGRKLDSTTS